MEPCERIADLIGPFLYNDLTEKEAAAVAEHLLACPRCREDVAARRAALGALTPEEPTSAERDRILKAVRSAAARSTNELRPRRLRTPLTTAAACAAGAVLFVFGMWVGLTISKTPPETSGVVVVKQQVPSSSAAVSPKPQETPKPQPRMIRERRRMPAVIVERSAARRPREPGERVTSAELVAAPVPEGVDDVRLAAVQE
jgi:hypothetical protein